MKQNIQFTNSLFIPEGKLLVAVSLQQFAGGSYLKPVMLEHDFSSLSWPKDLAIMSGSQLFCELYELWF